MKPAFTHCALHVKDLARSVAFYQGHAGADGSHEPLGEARAE